MPQPFNSSAFGLSVICVLVLVALLFRYLLITRLPYLKAYFQDGPWGDASTYYYLTQFFRVHDSGVSDERSLISRHPVSFPSLYLKTVGRCLEDAPLRQNSWLPNYVVYCACLVMFAVWLSFHYGTQDYQAVLLALLFFLVQADNVIFDRYRIQFLSLQPRLFGVCAVSLYWLLYIFANGWTFWAIKIFLLFLSLNSSKFARQTILFVSLVASAFSGELELIGNLVVASVVSQVIFPREFLPSLYTQGKHLWWYYNNYYNPEKAGAIWYAIKCLFSRPALEGVIYLEFWIILLACVAKPELLEAGIGIVAAERVHAVYLAVSVVFVCTGLRKFAFLGECWRYISFCTYFLSPVLVAEIAGTLGLTAVGKVMVVLFLFAVNSLIFVLGKKDINDSRHLLDLIKRHATELKNSVWYGVPYRTGTLPVAMGFGSKTFEFQHANMDIKTMAEYFVQYPILKPSKGLMRRHGVTHLLIEKSCLRGLRQDMAVDLNDPAFTLLDENEFFAIYRMASEIDVSTNLGKNEVVKGSVDTIGVRS